LTRNEKSRELADQQFKTQQIPRNYLQSAENSDSGSDSFEEKQDFNKKTVQTTRISPERQRQQKISNETEQLLTEYRKRIQTVKEKLKEIGGMKNSDEKTRKIKTQRELIKLKTPKQWYVE